MNYKEKIELAEQIAIQFKNGKNKTYINQWLEEKKIKIYDRDKVMFSAKKILKNEFLEQIIVAFKTSNEQSINQILNNLSPEIIEEIKAEGITELKTRHKKEINNRIKNGENDDEIINGQKLAYFNEEEIKEQIAFYKKYNEPPNGVEKDKFLMIGVPIVIIGLLVLLFVRLPSGRPPSLAILLVIYGGWNIYIAFTPPGVTELSDLNDKFN